MTDARKLADPNEFLEAFAEQLRGALFAQGRRRRSGDLCTVSPAAPG
jgi:hypothetical protein